MCKNERNCESCLFLSITRLNWFHSPNLICILFSYSPWDIRLKFLLRILNICVNQLLLEWTRWLALWCHNSDVCPSLFFVFFHRRRTATSMVSPCLLWNQNVKNVMTYNSFLWQKQWFFFNWRSMETAMPFRLWSSHTVHCTIYTSSEWSIPH